MATFGLNDVDLRELESRLRSMQGEVRAIDRELAKRAAESGAEAARAAAPADTGALASSIRVEETADGYAVVAEAPYAAFVEFGTGVTGARAGFPTPEDARAAGDAGYAHDASGHGEAGWTYYKDGSFHHTTGQRGRGFMAQGAEEARRVVGDARLNLSMRGGRK